MSDSAEEGGQRRRWVASPLRRALAGTVGASFALQAALVVSGVLTARLLGVEGRGYLALLILVPLALAHLVNFGVPLAIVYEVSRAPGAARNILRRVRGLVAAQLVVLTVLHALVLLVVLGGDPQVVRLAALVSLPVGPALALEGYALAVLQAQGDFSAFNRLRLLPPALYSVFVVIAFVLGVDALVIIVLSWVLTYLFGTAFMLRRAKRRLPPARVDADVPSPRDMLRFGGKSLLGAASPVEQFRLDQSTIGIFLSPVALGIYVTALAFTNLPRFVGIAIGVVAYPDVAAQTDEATARRRMWRYFALGLIPCGLVAVGLEVFAERLVLFFFGAEFAEAVPIMQVLLVSAFFLAGRRVLTEASRGAGSPGVGSLSEVISLVSLVPAVALGASLAGVTGVAVALVFSSALSLLTLVAALLFAGRRTARRQEERARGAEAAIPAAGEPGPA